MYPPVPRIRGPGNFPYDGPRSFGPRQNMYVRHGLRGFGGRHMDGPRPRHYRGNATHSFGPPIHNSFDSTNIHRTGPMINRGSPSVTDLIHQGSSTCDGTLLVS